MSGRAADTAVTGTVTAKGLSTNADVVVSLEAPGLSVKPPAAPAEVDQRGQFVPHEAPGGERNNREISQQRSLRA